MLSPSLPLVLLSAVSVSPASVPANGPQTAIVTVDKPTMVRVSAKSASGTACEVVDKVRGPFARGGEAGRKNCELDLLLDSGTYKLRLDSSKRGKGKVTVSAAAFPEVNAPVQKLVPGALVQTALPLGQQASFWFTVTAAARNPRLRVTGRTVGILKLWRSGEWSDDPPAPRQPISEPARKLYEWWLDRDLEPGDYLVTAYGANPQTWVGGNTNDALEVELGVRQPQQTTLAVTLGPSNVATVSPLGKAGYTAVLSLDGPPTGVVELESSSGGRCRIDKGTLVPRCAFTSSRPSTVEAPDVVAIHGPAGTRGTLQWQGFSDGNDVQRTQVANGDELTFAAPAVPSLVSVQELPADLDGAPLGCLIKGADSGKLLAADVPVLEAGQKLEHSFNYDSNGAMVWFRVARAGKYRLETKGGRKSTCELFALDAQGTVTRVSESNPVPGACTLVQNLNPGVYQLSLYQGLSGIEQVLIQEDGAKPKSTVPPKSSCIFPSLNFLERRALLSTNRAGSSGSRALVMEPTPLSLDAPLHLTLDPGAKLELPLTAKAAFTVRGSAAFGCSIDGQGAKTEAQCAVPATAKSLTLTHAGATPVSVSLFRPLTETARPTPQAFTAVPQPLPEVQADTPKHFDFSVGDSHSVVFDVKQAGLYYVTTQGLLTTSCSLRTAVIPSVASNAGAGRGRNCLVASYLRPGRYLATVQTMGNSRGRASVVLRRRPAREQATVASEGDAFFRVDPDDLVQQKLSVKKAGRYQLATAVQGADGAMRCRLDDSDGWPLLEVPTSCSLTRQFTAGTYLWTQLPLTVESMRHTSLKIESKPPVLSGNRKHPVQFFTWYQANLGRDGKDEFTFELDGSTDVDVVLTNGMQGRLYLIAADKTEKAVDLIPPTVSAEAPESDGMMEDEEGSAPPVEPDAEAEYSESEGESGDESPREDEYRDEAPTPRTEVVEAAAPPPPPAGYRLHLDAGSYRLVAEHSRGDVAIDYQLHLGAAVMLPGMARTLPTPARVPVRVARNGTLRLRTEGDADVRCRFFDAKGALVFEGSDNGADWNCSLAQPVAAGEYLLMLESETQSRSETKLSLALAPLEEKPAIADAASFKLGAAVQVWQVPTAPANEDVVYELAFRAKTPFSCALEAPDGTLSMKRSRVTDCSLLVRPQSEKYRVRVWTTDGTAEMTTALVKRPVQPHAKGEVASNTTALATLAAPGRYRTSPQIFCLPANQRGALRRCGAEVSLDAGPVLLATFGSKAQPASLEPITAAPTSGALSLSRTPSRLQLTGGDRSLFLLSAKVAYGERAAPSCAFEGASVREGRDSQCFAVSSVTDVATERLWAPVDDEQPIAAEVFRRAVKLPAKDEALAAGRKRVKWSGDAGSFALPAGQRMRVEATLPADAWGVLVDDQGVARELCAPTGQLARCAFSSTGGRLVLSSDSDRQADVSLTLLDAPEKSVAFTGLYEATPRLPGSVRLPVTATDVDRVATVEGARRCVVALSDGTRITGCRVEIPAKRSAELLVEHDLAAWRAMVHRPGAERMARLGIEAPVTAGPALNPATAIALGSARTDRTLVLAKDAVVRITSDVGVCGLFRGNDLLAVSGLDAGCDVARVLPAGTYRLLARPFAGSPQAGTLRWNAEPVVALGEGVGAEEWMAPGDARLYRFQTQSKGNVGLGIQTGIEALDCAVFDDSYRPLGEGCQQYLALEKGTYLLTVRLPQKPGAQPLKYKPVLLGLAGAKADVPTDYLEAFFRRIGGAP